MATLYVRRSGRFSNQKKRTQEDEVIDLTTEEWDREADAEFMNDEANEADETINEVAKKIGVDSMANGEVETSAMQEGVGIEADNIEKGTGKEKIDAGQTEEPKDCKLIHVSAERVMRKQKLAALVEKLNKMKDAKQVARKGKLAKLVKNSKKKAVKGDSSFNFDLNHSGKKKNGGENKKRLGTEHIRGNSVAVKWKMAENTGKGKLKNLDVGNEHIRYKPKEALDGEETDDNFVSSKKIKMNKAVSIKKKPSSATATNGKCIADPENSNVKEKAAKDKVKRVNRVHSRIPPNNLFWVMTQLSAREKQAVRDIGFGKLIDFKIKDIPTRLAYWLLDHFDEEACCLNINGKEIEITRELVRDVLGVPLGDIHLDAHDEANYRNPLTRAFKAQFPSSVKRHFPTRLADQMLSNGEGGWMFKVLYASSYTPIKWCTSDVLKTLEKDKFPNDDGDNADVVQESEDEGLDEEHVLEDDEFGEYGPDRVPTDVEKFISASLKRAAEMAELADDVLDEGLSLYQDDAGFMELKELRDQMFADRTFKQKPSNYQEPDDQTYDKFHTPCNGGTQYEDVVVEGDELPFTQLCATQGKEVGDEQEPQDVPEFKTPNQPKGASPKDRSTSRGLSRFGREYLTNNKSMVPVFLEPQPLNVLQPLIHQHRAKRHAILPEILRSPFVTATNYFVYRSDIVFQTDYCDGPRSVLETLYPGIKIASGAIDMFTHVLNDAERSRNKQTVTRLFCHTAMLVFFPMLDTDFRYFFIICINLKYNRIEYLDNIFSMETDPDARCGFPSMILTYRGEGDRGDRCFLKKEGPEQRKQINDLRYKYAAKILLADCNKAKSMVEQETHAFKILPVEEKKRLRAEAFEKNQTTCCADVELKFPMVILDLESNERLAH
ncbi:hypothetical protein Tco_0190035 [Tanacetum coccineum]